MAIYEYKNLISVIKVGSEVRAVPGMYNPCSRIDDSGTITKKITEVDESGFEIDGCRHSFKSGNFLEIIKGENDIKNKISNAIMTLVEKAKLALKGEPEKTFIKAGIMDMNDTFTTEGKELFKMFLYNKFSAEFKTAVVDPIIEADKAEATK